MSRRKNIKGVREKTGLAEMIKEKIMLDILNSDSWDLMKTKDRIRHLDAEIIGAKKDLLFFEFKNERNDILLKNKILSLEGEKIGLESKKESLEIKSGVRGLKSI